MKKSNPKTSTSKRRTRSSAESVLAYFDMRRKTLSSALPAAQMYYAVEGIHELRVEVKRLRALYELVEYVTPSFTAGPNASALTALFRAAGELRDIDIQQAITLKGLKKLDLREYFNQLKLDELRVRKSFAAVSDSFSKAALSTSRAQIRSALTVTTSQRLRKRFDKKISKLASKLAVAVGRNSRKDRDLHSIRKVAKALRYVLDIHQQCYGQGPMAEDVSIRLKRAFGYLGNWHDTVLTLEAVETFLKHETARDLADPGAYAAFRSELRGRAERLLATYARGRKPLQKALESLSDGMRAESN